MPQPEQCPYTAEPCTDGTRHVHGYHPPSGIVQRCSCGNRRWHITVGGALPPVVACDKCTKNNYGATWYERGRADGPRKAIAPHAAAPF